ncbi:hypothetical protein VL21_06890 [Stenotrophomonas maltophilia]|uniref:Peptidase S74 domain-containing protein n=1 Tax=Stenotrophomonas maltophilia TaxID=40324 RepID=A0AA40YDX3_STEMA|nr:hypothetical protein [Stenotrophomonas muris]KOO86026.1 hypothetical protein VL21_06890 [Stenotrophomonas maltophilia]MBH1790541.1 hypothetical protein [Stenotrophomonas maltophilia]MCR1817716.1 hypothetical protein [Stenotrophomonas muris]
MALQPIDTSTDHGTYKGDPAKTAFDKVNANDMYLQGLASAAQTIASAALPRAGGTLTGDTVLFGGTFRIAPNVAGDQMFLRSEGATGVTIDAVNNPNSAYAALSIRGSAINLNGPVNVSSTLSVPQNFKSANANVVLATGIAGTVFLRPNGTDSAVGQLTLGSTGICSAPSFNPTSSADVKDYIEGYAGDADSDLNRLVVITHKYRPEFLDSNKTYISLLAENVHSVLPAATDGDYQVIEQEPYERPVVMKVELPNEDGEGTREVDIQGVETAWREVIRYVPMNVNLMPILALCVRGHQTKDRRIRELEIAVASLQAIIQPPTGPGA